MAELTETDLVSIQEYFGDLEDPRSTINRKHLLGELIVICVASVIAGADGPKAIGIWAQSNADWLKQHLTLPYGIPSHDTIGRLLAALRPAAFQSCFQTWIASVAGQADSPDWSHGSEESQQPIIAVDGKALRRSHDRKNGLGALFLVSAWSTNGGISLGQLATEAKSNEITAIPELIDNIEVKGAIVTIDAAGCQKHIAAKIVDAGGDYVLALKGNQGNLHKAVIDWLIEQMDNDFEGIDVRHHVETSKGHGRIDTVEYFQYEAPEGLPNRKLWKGLRTVGVAIRTSRVGDQETVEARYFINSLELGVGQFAVAVRKHWGIENSLHWCLDVTFREDDSRVRNRHAADNLAWLRRVALSLLKQQKDKESIAMRRRMAGWNHRYLAQVLGLTTI
jgi:predicted transposase YbfD/YdcC